MTAVVMQTWFRTAVGSWGHQTHLLKLEPVAQGQVLPSVVAPVLVLPHVVQPNPSWKKCPTDVFPTLMVEVHMQLLSESRMPADGREQERLSLAPHPRSWSLAPRHQAAAASSKQGARATLRCTALASHRLTGAQSRSRRGTECRRWQSHWCGRSSTRTSTSGLVPLVAGVLQGTQPLPGS